MSTLQKIKQNVKGLSRRVQEALRDWLEDELEFTDEFKAKLECARQHMAAGEGRIIREKSS